MILIGFDFIYPLTNCGMYERLSSLIDKEYYHRLCSPHKTNCYFSNSSAKSRRFINESPPESQVHGKLVCWLVKFKIFEIAPSSTNKVYQSGFCQGLIQNIYLGGSRFVEQSCQAQSR